MTPEQFDALSTAIANISCAGGGGGGIALDDEKDRFGHTFFAGAGSSTFTDTYEISCDCVIERGTMTGGNYIMVYLGQSTNTAEVLNLGTAAGHIGTIAGIREASDYASNILAMPGVILKKGQVLTARRTNEYDTLYMSFRPVKACSGGGMTPEQFDALSTAIANISCAGGGGGLTLDDSQNIISGEIFRLSSTQLSGVYEIPCDCVIDELKNLGQPYVQI